MQPTDQISIAVVYSEQLSSNSGARYHRVTTYSVMKSVSEVVLASPKSQILRSQSAFNSRLLGFKSRCKTFAECTYFSPRNNWYRKYCQVQQTWYFSLLLIYYLISTNFTRQIISSYRFEHILPAQEVSLNIKISFQTCHTIFILPTTFFVPQTTQHQYSLLTNPVEPSACKEIWGLSNPNFLQNTYFLWQQC